MNNSQQGRLDPSEVNLSGITEEMAWDIQCECERHRKKEVLKARCQKVADAMGAKLAEDQRKLRSESPTFELWYQGHSPVPLNDTPLLEKIEELLERCGEA